MLFVTDAQQHYADSRHFLRAEQRRRSGGILVNRTLFNHAAVAIRYAVGAVLAFTLLACAGAPDRPSVQELLDWHVGAFEQSGGTPQNPQTVRLVCKPEGACTVTIDQLHRGKASETVVSFSGVRKQVNLAIPNNNLAYTRQNQAALLEEAFIKVGDSAFRIALEPLLRSQAMFDACHDLVSEKNDGFLVCHVQPNLWGGRAVILLVPLMTPVCGKVPFCAYWFIPLVERK